MALNKKFLNACETGDLETVKECIKKKYKMDRENRYGETYLMYASKYGHTKTAKLLLDNGAERNASKRNASDASTDASDAPTGALDACRRFGNRRPATYNAPTGAL